MAKTRRLAVWCVVCGVLGLGCDGSATAVPEPTGPTNVTEFRVSVMNACAVDVVVKLADSPGAQGREQVLLRNQRDTITGTREQLYLLSGKEVVASYRPRQGSQRLTISSDCSAMTPE